MLTSLRDLLRRVDIHPGEQRAVLNDLLRWGLIAAVIGLVTGASVALLMALVRLATAALAEHAGLVLLLPLAGFLIGWLYHHFGSDLGVGNSLLIAAANAHHERPRDVPLRMAPLAFVSAILSLLFGASVSTVGASMQMGAAMASTLGRILRLMRVDRTIIVMAGLSAGFSSGLGAPAAGVLLALEVRHVGRIRYDAIIPCLIASFTGYWIAGLLGMPYTHYPAQISLTAEPVLLIKVILSGLIFGVAAMAFLVLLGGVRRALRRIPYPPLRMAAGGLIVVALTLLVGSTTYNGLSSGLIVQAVNGASVDPAAFLLKLIFSGVSIGAGFIGGDVTPLLVVGSTLGASLAPVLGLPQAFLAILGYSAVFGAAANVPMTVFVLGIELFGGGSAIYLLIACFIAYLVSGHRSLIGTQLVDTPKVFHPVHAPEPGESLDEFGARRRQK